MTITIRTILFPLLLLAAGTQGTPQPTPDPTITFAYDRPGLPVPAFLLTLHRDGTGTYAATVAPPASAPSRYSPYPPPTPAPPTQITRPIAVTPQLTAQIFDGVAGTNRFHGGCESRAKNIANTGGKTLTYTGPEGDARCTYNYTESKAIASLADTFLAIAFTLDEGRKLEHLHRYDRLGLDAEMSLLSDAVRESRALELGNLATTLTSISADAQVLERVRTRAAALLSALPTAPPPPR